MKRRYSVSLLVVCCVLSMVGAQFALAQWVQVGSGMGQVFNIQINPTNQQIMYAASNTLGVYKSTDGGTTWAPSISGLLNLTVQAMAISGSNPNILYCGTSQTGASNGVYKSTDAGATWALNNTGITEASIGIQAIAVDPTNPNTVYVSVFDGVTNATTGIWKTTDGGANWFASSTGTERNKNFLSLAINPLNPNTIYVGSSFISADTLQCRIYKSTNAGAVWIDVSNGLPITKGTTTHDPVRSLSIQSIDTNRVLAGVFLNEANGGAYITTNGGGVWTRIQNGLPVTVGTLPRSVLIKPGSTTEFFVGLGRTGDTDVGVYRTTDAGATWVSFVSGALTNTTTVRWLAYNTAAAQLFAGGANATIATFQGVFRYQFTLPGTHDIGVLSLAAGTLLDAPSGEKNGINYAEDRNAAKGAIAEIETAPIVNDAAKTLQTNHIGSVSMNDDVDALAVTAPVTDEPVSSIIPVSDFAPNTPLNFRALVRNYGTFAETTYQVGWTIDGTPQTPVNQPRILQVGATDTLTLTWASPTTGNHVARAFTILASDANHSNDTASSSFTVTPPVTVLYDNGPLSTGPVTKSGVVAPSGSTWSEVQNPANDTTQSNTTSGFSGGITTTTRYRVADNFIVPTGQSWRIDSISTFAYQTGAVPGTSPFIALNMQIWRGRPGDSGAVVVAGDTITNRLSSSAWTTYYRIFNTRYPTPGTVPGTTRPVFKNNVNMGGVTLGPGTYWLDWQTQITASAAHFAPSVTVVGVRGNPAWNGRQWIGTLWQDALDAGNPATAPDSVQDFPFVIMGSATSLTRVLSANPGPTNNSGSANWAMFFNLIAGPLPVTITQMTTASGAVANASYSVVVFKRSGNALGGPVSSGPGSSIAGWDSLGTVPVTQGPVANEVSLPFAIPNISLNPHDTVGVAIRFLGVGPRYFGTGIVPYSTYSDTNLTLVTGDARSTPFTPTGSFFSSRALVGEVRYTLGTVGVREPGQESPMAFALLQNYPNPFNPTTTLRYGLPKDARVNLSIYNILGQRVTTLKDGVQSVGYYDVVWDGRNDFGSQIASGVYFYRIEAKPVDGSDAFTSIKKMLMLK